MSCARALAEDVEAAHKKYGEQHDGDAKAGEPLTRDLEPSGVQRTGRCFPHPQTKHRSRVHAFVPLTLETCFVPLLITHFSNRNLEKVIRSSTIRTCSSLCPICFQLAPTPRAQRYAGLCFSWPNTLTYKVRYTFMNRTVMRTVADVKCFLDGVHREIDATLAGREPVTEDRKNLPYTDAVIHETQRLANIVPLNLPHMTSCDVNFNGYVIKKVSFACSFHLCSRCVVQLNVLF